MEPEDKFVTTHELSLHYLDWGNAEAPLVVLIHGLCANAHYWDFFARNMKGDYHIIALDLRGHGDSSWAESYGPRDYATDIEALTAELELHNMALIGHSLGGINAIVHAARHPEEVNKLVIVDIGPELEFAGTERLLKQWTAEPEFFDSMEEAVNCLKQAEPGYSDDFIRHQLKYAIKRNEQGKLRFKCDSALHETSLNSPEWLWEYIAQIICPTLLLHASESDMLSADVAQQMSDNLAFGSLIEIPNAGHGIPGDNPEAFEEAVRNFLSMGTDLDSPVSA